MTEDEMAAEYQRVIHLTVEEISQWCATHDWHAYRTAWRNKRQAGWK